MVRTVPSNRGFTLIEMMISILIIMVSMLALLVAITHSIRINVQNEMRNGAIRVTNETAEALLALPLNDSELDETPAYPNTSSHTRITDDDSQAQKGLPNTKQKLRNYEANYSIKWWVASPTPDLKQVNIEVSYVFRNQTVKHNALTYKYRSI